MTYSSCLPRHSTTFDCNQDVEFVQCLGKLKGLRSGNPITFPFQKTLNGILFLVLLGLGASVMGIFQVGGLTSLTVFAIFTVIALLLGILLVILDSSS